jgi:hypothetical protein
MHNMEQSFYEVLHEREEFTKALGRMVLSSAKFEYSLKEYMDSQGKISVSEKSPLGGLLKLLVKNHTIDQTASEQFWFLLHQRNCFVHKLYGNLAEYPKNEFELKRFINRLNSVSDEMEFFSTILIENTKKSCKADSRQQSAIIGMI